MSQALKGFRAQGGVAFGSMLQRLDELIIEELIRGAPDEDTGWLNPEGKRQWAADLRDALQTYDGFARDNVARGADWDIDPASPGASTWLWYGELDRMVPLSHGHWLAERIHTARLVVRAGKGHGGTTFEYWDDMLVTLRDEVLQHRQDQK